MIPVATNRDLNQISEDFTSNNISSPVYFIENIQTIPLNLTKMKFIDCQGYINENIKYNDTAK